MAPQFRPYDDQAGRETRARWSNSLEGIFDAYQQAKRGAQIQGRLTQQDALAADQRAMAEKDRQGAVLLGGGVDPRQVTPANYAQAQQAEPIMGPESPVIAAIRAHIEKRKTATTTAAQEQQLGMDKTRSEIDLNNARADAADQDQIFVDTDTGKQIVVPRGAKLIPRPPKGGKMATNQDLNSAMELYETAKQGLMEGLGGSETGAIMGRMPAVTAKQQIAKGSVAAMAPVLKQIFRTAGEGVFTDRDQQLLLDMIPTRTELPEARTAMIANIDAIVKAKIKSGMRQTQAEPESQPEVAPLNATEKARLEQLRARRGR